MVRKEEAELLAALPFKLRSRMLQHFYADMLSRVPAINRLPPHILIEFVSQLKAQQFVEGDDGAPTCCRWQGQAGIECLIRQIGAPACR